MQNELAEQPQVPDDLWPIMEAWFTLNRTKHNHRDPIPISEILAYLDARCIISPDLRLEYVELISLLDFEYRKLSAS